jgi:hypothetical protein
MGKLSEALARGYCTKRNSKKVLDPDLIEDMGKEILAEIEKLIPPKMAERGEGDNIWNSCRKIILDRIKELKGGKG